MAAEPALRELLAGLGNRLGKDELSLCCVTGEAAGLRQRGRPFDRSCTRRRWSSRAYLTVFIRGIPGPRNGSVRLRTRLVVVLPNAASSSTISSRWAIDVAAIFMT